MVPLVPHHHSHPISAFPSRQEGLPTTRRWRLWRWWGCGQRSLPPLLADGTLSLRWYRKWGPGGARQRNLWIFWCVFFPVEFKVELSWTILNWLFLLDFRSKTKRKLFHKGMSWQVQAGTKHSFPFWTLGVHRGFMVWSNSVYPGPFSLHPTVNVTGNHRNCGQRRRKATVWLAACLSMQSDLEPLVPVT